MPWYTTSNGSPNPKPAGDVNENVGGKDKGPNPSPPPPRNPNNNNNNVPAPAPAQASSASSSKEDQGQAQAQKQQQHAASVQSKHHEPRTEAPTMLRLPSKQEADSRDNEINSRRGTSTEHSMHKGASVQSNHHEPQTEVPTVLRSVPSKQEAADSRDNETINSRGITEHPVRKEGVVLPRIPSKDDQAVRNDFAGLRSGHPTRVPSKQEADLSDNERPRLINNIIEARVHKEEGHVLAPRTPSKDQHSKINFDGLKEQSRNENQERKEEEMPAKDQAPLTSLRQEHDRPKDNGGGVTNRPADPPANNNPIININVYVTDHQQPKSVGKNDAIKENNESSFCERCKKLCSIL